MEKAKRRQTLTISSSNMEYGARNRRIHSMYSTSNGMANCSLFIKKIYIMFSTSAHQKHSSLIRLEMGSLNALQLLVFDFLDRLKEKLFGSKIFPSYSFSSFFFNCFWCSHFLAVSFFSFIYFLVQFFIGPCVLILLLLLVLVLLLIERVSENFADEKWVVCTEFSFTEIGRLLTHFGSIDLFSAAFFRILSLIHIYFSCSAYNLYSIWYFVISSVCFQSLVCIACVVSNAVHLSCI